MADCHTEKVIGRLISSTVAAPKCVRSSVRAQADKSWYGRELGFAVFLTRGAAIVADQSLLLSCLCVSVCPSEKQ